MPSIEAFYDFTFLDQSEVRLWLTAAAAAGAATAAAAAGAALQCGLQRTVHILSVVSGSRVHAPHSAPVPPAHVCGCGVHSAAVQEGLQCTTGCGKGLFFPQHTQLLSATQTFPCFAQEGLHYTVDCGKDLFTATTQNWGKTRMVSLEELARTDRCALRQRFIAFVYCATALPLERGVCSVSTKVRQLVRGQLVCRI